MTEQSGPSKRRPRLYEFTEQVPNPATTVTTSGGEQVSFITATDWTMTTHKPNPFHGIDRWVFALDEWAHRRGMGGGGKPGHLRHAPRGWYLTPFPYLCNWFDRRMTRG